MPPTLAKFHAMQADLDRLHAFHDADENWARCIARLRHTPLADLLAEWGIDGTEIIVRGLAELDGRSRAVRASARALVDEGVIVD